MDHKVTEVQHIGQPNNNFCTLERVPWWDIAVSLIICVHACAGLCLISSSWHPR